jgi:anhydro-N-acetylmuramic acid kinase
VRVAGLISGTSHDAVDAVVADVEQQGETLHAHVLAAAGVPYPAGLRTLLVSALPPATVGMDVVCELDTRLGQFFAEAAAAVIDAADGADLVCSHGQTVYHWIAADGSARGGLQLGQPAWIAARTGLPVVSDLRSADIAAGGQGAPLVALMDEWLLAGVGSRPVAVNLGGIANISIPAVTGRAGAAYDTGPANALLDAAVVRAGSGESRFDADGALAATGRVDPGVLAALLTEPYYSRPAPKSTGKELFHPGYLERVPGLLMLPVEDQLATLAELTATTVARAVLEAGADVAVLSGGGVRNPVVMRRIRALAESVSVLTYDELGVDPDAKEALLFAVLGWLTWHGIAGASTAYTGAARPVVLGSVTPGTDLRWPFPPDPSRRPIRRLVVADAGPR